MVFPRIGIGLQDTLFRPQVLTGKITEVTVYADEEPSGKEVLVFQALRTSSSGRTFLIGRCPHELVMSRAVLGKKNLPASLEKFQAMKYTQSEEWERSKSLYREVKWQKDAQANKKSGYAHTLSVQGETNSVFDLIGRSGKIEKRRYYGRTGWARLDIDLTDHGNPKKHTIVPHAHSNIAKDEEKRYEREEPGRKLTLAEQMANADILRGGMT